MGLCKDCEHFNVPEPGVNPLRSEAYPGFGICAFHSSRSAERKLIVNFKPNEDESGGAPDLHLWILFSPEFGCNSFWERESVVKPGDPANQ